MATFPLSIHASGRYLIDVEGRPFLIHGDTPWSLVAQLTNAEIDTYLDDRADKEFNAILINAPENFYTSQTPTYQNVDGDDPFSTMTDYASTLVENYWTRVDYVVNGAKTRGMVCIINPVYLGAGTDGWSVEVLAESDADLQTFGAALANRYTQGNVIWCMGGDKTPGTTELDKQWNVVTGMRTVRTTDLITAHSGPGAGAYTTWNGETGFNFNTAYPYNDEVASICIAEYNRAGPMPFIMLEARYEQEPSPAKTDAQLRLQSYQALCSGACGQLYGNNPIWHFESPNTLYSYSGTWESNLDTTAANEQTYVKRLFDAYAWHILEPKTDTSVVTTALGSGDSKICPTLANNGSFSLIWTPNVNFTVDLSAFTPPNLRARWYNPTDGTYSTDASSPLTNTGTQAFTAPGDRVLCIDPVPGTSGSFSFISRNY